MTLPFVGRIINGTAPTSTGFKEFTAVGMDNCAGAKIIATWATADDTARAGTSKSVGFVDGTNQRCSFGYSRDSAATSVAKSGGNSTAAIRLLDPTDGSVALVAVFSSFVTTPGNGGIKLNFTAVSSDAFHIKIVLFGGSNAECLSWREQGGVAANTVTTGFLVDFNLTELQLTNDNTLAGKFQWEPGFSRRTAAAPSNGVMCSVDHAVEDAVTTTNALRGKFTGRLGWEENFGGTPAVGFTKIQNYTSTGFDLIGKTGLSGAAGPFLIGLAVKVTSVSNPVSVFSNTDKSTPGSTGVETNTTPGFRVGMMLVPFSSHHTNGSRTAFSSVGYGMTDMVTTACVQFREEQANATASSNASLSHQSLLRLLNHSGSSTFYRTQGITRNANGYALDWATVASPARRYGFIAIQELAVEADFSVSASSRTAAFDARQVAKASFGAEQSGPAASFSGQLVTRAAFSATQGSLSAAFAAALVSRATFSAVQSSPSIAMAAKQLLRATFGATQGSASASFAVALEFRATFSAVQGSPSAAFVASIGLQATFSAAQGSPTATFAALQVLRATFGAVQGSPSAAFTAFTPVGGATLTATFTAIQSAATAAFLARLPGLGSKTCLLADLADRTELQADRSARSDFLASRKSRSALEGDRVERTLLAGAYDTRTPLAASKERC